MNRDAHFKKSTRLFFLLWPRILNEFMFGPIFLALSTVGWSMRTNPVFRSWTVGLSMRTNPVFRSWLHFYFRIRPA
jgi:hypothetical protein